MKKRDALSPLARAYYDLLGAAHLPPAPSSVVLIAPPFHKVVDGDDDELLADFVRIPKTLLTLCWSIAEYSEEECIDSLVHALRAFYRRDLTHSHVGPLLYEIDDEMLRTAENAGLLLTITATGRLHCGINGYTMYYKMTEWRIELPEGEHPVKSLAEAIQCTARLRPR
jgi:hypothetical protein